MVPQYNSLEPLYVGVACYYMFSRWLALESNQLTSSIPESISALSPLFSATVVTPPPPPDDLRLLWYMGTCSGYGWGICGAWASLAKCALLVSAWAVSNGVYQGTSPMPH
jgi:hypothetical protein